LFSRIQTKYLPTELSELIERDLAEYTRQKEAESRTREEEDDTTITVTTVTTTTTTKTEKTVKKKNPQVPSSAEYKDASNENSPIDNPLPNVAEAQNADSCAIDPGHVLMLRSSSPGPLPPPPPAAAAANLPSNNMEIFEDENLVYLGLRVYTNKEAPAKVSGRQGDRMNIHEEQRMPRSPIRSHYRSRSLTPQR
jgi:hypothetical protein